MSEEFILNANRRTVIGKRVRQLRRSGKLPAVVYGYGLETTPIVLDHREASRMLRDTSVSTLLTLNIDGDEHNVLVREVQRGILSRAITHVDFQAIAMDVVVRTQVPLVLVSDEEVPAVRDFGAVLIASLDSMEIECLPKYLPDQIEVDVSGIETIGDGITVSELSLPEGVTAIEEPDTTVVVASAPDTVPVEEEEEELEEELLLEGEPEVIEKGKTEDDEEEFEE